jgi:excisionase family DNA binding protein
MDIEEKDEKEKIVPTEGVLDFYTIEQLAKRFACEVAYLRKMVRDKKLVGVQVGKRLIFSAANVQTFLKSLENETNASQKKSEVMNAKKKKAKS